MCVGVCEHVGCIRVSVSQCVCVCIGVVCVCGLGEGKGITPHPNTCESKQLFWVV